MSRADIENKRRELTKFMSEELGIRLRGFEWLQLNHEIEIALKKAVTESKKRCAQ